MQSVRRFYFWRQHGCADIYFAHGTSGEKHLMLYFCYLIGDNKIGTVTIPGLTGGWGAWLAKTGDVRVWKMDNALARWRT